jgi:DNA helicase-2/ATP-dependent DNA helicase PcrA
MQAVDVFKQESDHLKAVIHRLEEVMQTMLTRDELLSKDLKDSIRYLKDQLGSLDGDLLQATEFNQHLMIEKQLLEQRGYQDQKFVRYQRLVPKPYFARVDFKEEYEKDYETLYIGYANFMDDETLDIHIYDWRTPVASIFYDYQTGPVRYRAPDGLIFGDVSLKRQFDIKEGKLLSYVDTESHLADERLIDALSERTAGPMHPIVETIQAQQNRIIREKQASIIFVEGIAGSGKTVVALHRMAYLLYHGMKSSLSAQQILVLSPNDVFSDYIAHVIPELGEEQVRIQTLTEVIESILGKMIDLEMPFHVLERQLRGSLMPWEIVGRRLKQDPNMATLLEKWLEVYIRNHLPYCDFYYGEERVGTALAMKRALLGDADYQKRPIIKRIERYCERVYSRVRDLEKAYYAQLVVEEMLLGKNPFDYRAVARLKKYKTFKALSTSLQEFKMLCATDIYRHLLMTPKFWVDFFDDTSLEDIEVICEKTIAALDGGTLTQDDWVIIASLHVMMHSDHSLSQIKHVVVDESQDYSVMAFNLFNRAFPKVQFTVLGDYHQTLHGNRNDLHHNQVAAVFQREDVLHMNLSIAYRNVAAIGALCLGLFSQETSYSIVPREGNKPKLFRGKKTQSLGAALASLHELGLKTVALLTKTMEDARCVYDTLNTPGVLTRGPLKSYLVTPESLSLPKGLLVMPIYTAKGMEFDSVILYDVGRENYTCETDRQLLYVGASRALHHLILTCEGSLSTHLEPLLSLVDEVVLDTY